MAYELVLFDLGGVAVDFEADRLVHQVSQLIGRNFEEVQAAVYDPQLLGPLERGQVRPEAYYDGLKAKLELPWTYEQFARAWNDILRENPDVTGFMPRLRKRHKLMALTNTNALHLAYMKATMPSLALLDDWIASCEVGHCKPDPRIYQVALDRAGVSPRQAVYIDDRPELVQAGRGLGLTAIHFESSHQLAEELRAIGLNI